MKRVFRWSFNFAAVVSALLCLAVCVLWVRGYWRLDVAVLNFGDATNAYPRHVGPRDMILSGSVGTSFEADSTCGEFALSRVHFHRNGGTSFLANRPGSYPVTTSAAARQLIEPELGSHILGAILSRYDDASSGVDFLVIPCWAAALATATLPLWAVFRRSRRRNRPGLCRSCGYDLRATPQAGGALLDRCPECGVERTARGQQLQPAK